ncbi:MAG TPA: ketopantoate reductase family protein [Anaerolineae bacterium]|nr:ketopantoate reductase family protein [Anaerolineae bacterium]
MQISIIGTGAMATLFAARLADVADVAMIGSWAEAIETIKQQGIVIDGDSCCHQVHTAYHPDDAPAADLALVLTKTYKTIKASEVAAKTIKPDGVALTLQNGLGNIEILSEHVGRDRALQGVTMQGATLLGPGRIRTSGRGATHLGYVPIELAAPRDFGAEHRAYEISALFNSAGLKSHVTADIDGLVWGKVIINAAINPLTAILRVPNGALVESDETIGLMQAAAREAAAIAKAKGITLPFSDPVERVKQVATLTATNHSSMLQDVLGQRPTEIESINGKIVEQGQALGIPMPVNALLTSLIRAIEKNYTAEAVEIAEKELQRQLRSRS